MGSLSEVNRHLPSQEKPQNRLTQKDQDSLKEREERGLGND